MEREYVAKCSHSIEKELTKNFFKKEKEFTVLSCIFKVFRFVQR